MKCASSRDGFTLIEILVVLVIVAIIAAVAVMSFGHFGRGRREKIIVNQFVRTITIAQQQAILKPVVLKLSMNAKGYQYSQYNPLFTTQDTQWQSLRDDSLSSPHAFTTDLQLQQNKKTIAQTILFLPAGFVTPFTCVLLGASHVYAIVVANNGVAQVTITPRTNA